MRPEAKLPTNWCASACQANEAGQSRVTSQPVTSAWWTSFNDPELLNLEYAAAGANLDFWVASLRLAESARRAPSRRRTGILPSRPMPASPANARGQSAFEFRGYAGSSAQSGYGCKRE